MSARLYAGKAKRRMTSFAIGIAPALLMSGYAHLRNIAPFVLVLDCLAPMWQLNLQFEVFYYVSYDKASSNYPDIYWPDRSK